MGTNLDLMRATYEGSSEDNGRNLAAALASDATRTEAEGFPYASTYIGVDAITPGVFHRLGTEWIGYSAEVHTTWIASEFARSLRALVDSRAMTRADGVRARPLWLAFSARRRR